MAKAHHVFVYGSLRKGLIYSGIFEEGHSEYLGPGTISAMLCYGYLPYVVLRPEVEGYTTKGEVHLIDDALLAELDHIEGIHYADRDWYNRIVTSVNMGSGHILPTAYVYAWLEPHPDDVLVRHGDFVKFVDEANLNYRRRETKP